MCPNLVAPLDESKAYIYCPTCRNGGTPNVMLTRSMHMLSCPFGHQFTSLAQIERLNAEMVPMSAVMQEQPNPQSIKWPIYVMPNTRAEIERKFQGRVWTTIGTLLDCLVDDALIFLQGSEAKELKKRGLQNGVQILAALDAVATLQRERDDAMQQLQRFQRMLQSATTDETV